MISYEYIVAWWKTPDNEAEFTESVLRGVETKKIFNDPVAASSWAMENGWYPFVVERIERGD